jgi:hypothetical protein
MGDQHRFPFGDADRERLRKGAFHTGQVAFAVEWLQKCEIDSTPLLAAMAGDVAAISCLSRKLLVRALDYQAASKSRDRRRASKNKSGTAGEGAGQSMGLVRGEGHLPRSVVGFFITMMIEACARAGMAPPETLTQLVRVHLEADTFAAQDEKAPGALDKAACYKLAYPDANQAEIARHAGVSRPRISQWIEDGSLDRAVERYCKLVSQASELI